MGAMLARRTADAALLLLCVLLAACGDDGQHPTPAPTPAPVQEQTPAVAAAQKAPRAPDAPTPEEVDAALHTLETEDRAARRRAVEVLLRGAHTYKEITHLALRAARLERDVGLLADLLTDHPDATLPHVLHRVTHAAALQRGQICRALGRRRERRTAALAVLTVRALLNPAGLVRSEARLALDSLWPGSKRIVQIHYEKFPRSVDGSVTYVSPSLLLGAGNMDAETPYRRALELALDAEAARFGPETVQAVRGYRDELAGAPPPQGVGEAAPSGWRKWDYLLAELLAADCADHFDPLRALLERPGLPGAGHARLRSDRCAGAWGGVRRPRRLGTAPTCPSRAGERARAASAARTGSRPRLAPRQPAPAPRLRGPALPRRGPWCSLETAPKPC